MNKEQIHKKVKHAHVMYAVMFILIRDFGIVFFYLFFDKNIFHAVLVIALQYIFSGILRLCFVNFLDRFKINQVAGLSFVFFMLAFVVLYLFGQTYFAYLLPIYVLFASLSRFMYISVYQIFLNHTMPEKNIGNDMSNLRVWLIIANTIFPILIGFVSDFVGSIGLVFFGIGVGIIPIFIYSKLPDIEFRFKIKPKELLQDRIYRKIIPQRLLASIYFPLGFIWSIWIFNTFNQEFKILGLFIGGLNLVAAVFVMQLGKRLDKTNKKSVNYSHSFFNALELILKGISINSFLLVFSDLFGRLNRYTYGVIHDSYFVSLIGHHQQKELFDERAFLGDSIYDIFAGIVLLISAVLTNWLDINYIFMILSIMWTMVFIFFRLNKNSWQEK